MNQHYVPRSYLKAFAEQKKREYYVSVYDKLENRFFKSNIKNICSEVDFYTLSESNPVAKDILAVEKIYSNGMEPLYLKAYEILTNNNIHKINNLERAEILLGIFQLHIRNPKLLKRSIAHHEREILNLYQKAIRGGAKGLTYLDEDFSFRDWTIESILQHFISKTELIFKERHINIIKKITAFHERAIFDVCVIKDNSEFMTNDNPVVWEDLLSTNEDPFLKSKKFTVPLNKKFALVMYHDNTKQMNRIYRHYHPNGSVAIINQLIIEQANRFVITEQHNFNWYQDFKTNYLESTELDLKIDGLKQIVEKIPVTPENKDSHEIINDYLKRYEANGTLTKIEQYEFYFKIKNSATKSIKEKIK